MCVHEEKKSEAAVRVVFHIDSQLYCVRDEAGYVADGMVEK